MRRSPPLMQLPRPRKRFSQNFLVDSNYVARIVEAIAPRPQDRLLEIGPGFGALTGALLERVDSMDAVEIDRDAVRALRERFPPARLRVHEGDALDFDFCALGTGLRLVGNLPYHISTPLLFRVDAAYASVRDCHFMLQKEVVERMAAIPGTRQYGRLTVMLQYHWRVERLFDVPPGAFRPRPKVWSAIARMLPLGQPASQARDHGVFSRLVAAAFMQRRKTLRNALRDLLAEVDIAGCGIDPGARAETLGIAEFVRLANRAAARLSVRAG
ncbi:MAG TPA: 16S rRNA (adenine(1518)-N(6)/adenine(1519)-N(6))-dimethyltransferase RsmA [Burkholderiales bacterium]|nr:16S rRNA (adenine(1518)-N(6)/adenine(1519)-N(6))-dimethyltransferase RsmA [Burkholderiales bacterium]